MLAIRRCSFGRRTTASTQKIAENVTSPSTVITLMAHNRYFQSIKKLSHAASSTKSSTIVQNSHSSERARINFFFLLKESVVENSAWPAIRISRSSRRTRGHLWCARARNRKTLFEIVDIWHAGQTYLTEKTCGGAASVACRKCCGGGDERGGCLSVPIQRWIRPAFKRKLRFFLGLESTWTDLIRIRFRKIVTDGNLVYLEYNAVRLFVS